MAKRPNERRLSSRKRVTVDVYVDRPGQPRSRGLACNLSQNGVFVRLPELELTRGASLDLVFVLPMGKVVKVHRVRGRVARVAESGLGLRLTGATRAVRPAVA